MFKILSYIIIYMNCNKEMHNELAQSIYRQCPFCNTDLKNNNVKYIPKACYNNQNIESTDGSYICLSCGKQSGPDFQNPFVNFYENMYKIRKTSFYIRKYHVQNVLSDIEHKNQLPISRAIINLVCKIFDLINTVLPQVNQDRKRIISIKFVIHKLFVMWKLPHVIQISKSNKTLKYY